MTVEFIVSIIAVLLSVFFTGMEIAYVSANKFQIELQKKSKGFISKIVSKLTEKSSKFITAMSIGNSIALVIYSFFMSEVVLNYLVLNTFNPFQIILVQALILAAILLLTAEFLPQALFKTYANELFWFFAPLAYIFYLIFFFIADFVLAVSNLVLKLFFNSATAIDQNDFSKEELGNYIAEQLEQAEDAEEVDSEIQIFQNALEFDSVKAREIMIPRTEIEAVDSDENIENLRQLFVETGYSKILVYRDNLDDVLGYANAFELFKQPKTVKSMLFPVEFVPESMLINNVLNILIKKKRSIAVVLDEFGGTSGIITVEDIVEELFGEIVDEHDTVELLENQISENEFTFSARLEVDYLNETYNLDLTEHEAYETLGGYIVYHNENIPKENEELTIQNYYFKMLKVDSSKIMEVYLKVLDQNN
jgi:CBS domain containing-hemolysin-like protein